MNADETKIEQMIVVGLMIIALVLVVGILILDYIGKPANTALIVMAGGITGGLIGYIGKGKQKGDTQPVDASGADTVTVNTGTGTTP